MSKFDLSVTDGLSEREKRIFDAINEASESLIEVINGCDDMTASRLQEIESKLHKAVLPIYLEARVKFAVKEQECCLTDSGK